MAAVTVTTSATLIYSGEGTASSPDQVIITNDSGNSVYLGKNEDVTATDDADNDGVHLATGTTLGMEVRAGERVYGIAGSSSEVRVVGW